MILAGCQRSEIMTVQDLHSLPVRYAVSLDAMQTRSGVSGTASELPMVLSDGDGLRTLPMQCHVSSGMPSSPALTRGTQVNGGAAGLSSCGIDTFRVVCHAGGELVASQRVSYGGGAWSSDVSVFWPDSTTVMSFLACTNFPSGDSQEYSFTPDGLSAGYAVPQAAKDQNDILLGYCSGSARSCGGVATIQFGHPLTAVRFRHGDIPASYGAVSGISLSGVAASGTVTMSCDGTLAWDMTGTEYGLTVSQEAPSGDTLTVGADGIIGEPFIIIPQDLDADASGHSVTVRVTFEDGTTLKAVLDGQDWQAGTTYTYNVGYAGTVEPLFCFGDSSETKSVTFSNTTSTQTQSIPVTSTVSIDGGAPIGRDWKIKELHVGSATTPVTVNGTSATSDMTGGYGIAVSGDRITIESAKRDKTSESVGKHAFWIGGHDLWSPEDWTAATASAPIDLSRFDFRTETTDNPMTTANCYIIRHAGTYRIPLVYGNAVTGGVTNGESFYPDANGRVTDKTRTEGNYGETGNFRLVRFENHLGNGITDAFIENNEGCTAKDAAIVWQDKANVISSVSLTGTETTPGSYDTGNVRYLEFTVDQDVICQNNSVIAVRDESGRIMWSWHIWCTNDPSLLNDPISVTNRDDHEYRFFPIGCLGYVDVNENGCYPGRAPVRIVLEQDGTGSTLEITVNMNSEVIMDGGESHGTWYQFGRKDPLTETDSQTLATGEMPCVTSGNPQGTLQNTILYPGTMFGMRTQSGFEYALGNWCKYFYSNLWTGIDCVFGNVEQSEKMIKTVYDPSPAGYKVPASRAFSGFATGDGQLNYADYASTYDQPIAAVNASNNTFNGMNEAKGFHFYTCRKDRVVAGETPTIFFPRASGRSPQKWGTHPAGTYGDYLQAFELNANYWACNFGARGESTLYGLYMHYNKAWIDVAHPYQVLSNTFSVRPVKE